MPYIGSSPNFGAVESQTITSANGSTATFTLSQYVPDSDSIIVTVGNVVQEPTTAYSALGNSITFTENVPNGDTIVIRYLGRSIDVPTTYKNVNRFKFVATSGQDTFQNNDANGLALSYTAGNIDVFMNGVRLDESDFTASNGTSVVLVTNASASDEIVIIAYKSVQIANALDKSAGGTVSGNTVFSGALSGNTATFTGDVQVGDGADKLGINTDDPHSFFDVAVNGFDSGRRFGVGYNDSIVSIYSHGGTGGLENLSIRGDNIMFYSDYDSSNPDGVERMRLTSTGRLGIGTTAPDTPLQVRNDTDTDYNIASAVTNSVLNLKNTTSGANNCVGMSYSTEGNGEWFFTAVQESSTECAFRIGARSYGTRKDRLVINSDGTVGIGTSTIVGAWALRAYNNHATHASVEARNNTGGGFVFKGLNANGSLSSSITQSGIGYFANGVSSDQTLKNVKGTMNDGWNKLKDVQPKSFTWKNITKEINKEGKEVEVKTDKDLDSNIHYGVMAQDLKKVIPDLVYGEEGGMSVDYNGLLMVAINTIKELEARIKELEKA